MEQHQQNCEASLWQDVLKVYEDREPRHFDFKDGKFFEINSGKTGENGRELKDFRNCIEPWLTALFQNEHLNLLVGSGLTSATCWLAAQSSGATMSKADLSSTHYGPVLEKAAENSAKLAGRAAPNIEDQIRTINKLIEGLEILEYFGLDYNNSTVKSSLNNILYELIGSVLETEKMIDNASDPSKQIAARYLMSFLLSFASRTASRDRLHIFTTNYDRLIEWAADMAGIRLMDRFVGTLSPFFRSSRLELDMHYNPPGIRGEPRYLEGLARFTKLHGSLDWSYQNRYIRKIALPFGAESFSPYLKDSANCLIYPNSAKDRETAEFPYVELFRDLAAATCRPNTVLVCYGYGFGDEHINRVIEDMLSIPSTHLVIISFGDEGNRISSFYQRIGRSEQISLLIGKRFADLVNLVDHFLPKPAIDLTVKKVCEMLAIRGENPSKERGVGSSIDRLSHVAEVAPL